MSLYNPTVFTTSCLVGDEKTNGALPQLTTLPNGMPISTVLELQSDKYGFVVTRITDQAMNNLTPKTDNGTIVYNTTTNVFNFLQGGAWFPLVAALGGNVNYPGVIGDIVQNRVAIFENNGSTDITQSNMLIGDLAVKSSSNRLKNLNATPIGLSNVSFVQFDGIDFDTGGIYIGALPAVNVYTYGQGDQATTVIFDGVTPNPSSSSISATLEINATEGALLLSRISNLTNITSPINGMILYNSSTNAFNFRQNGAWVSLGGGGGGITGPSTTTDNGLVTWSGTVGGTVQNTTVTIDGNSNIAGANNITAANNVYATGGFVSTSGYIALLDNSGGPTPPMILLSSPNRLATTTGYAIILPTAAASQIGQVLSVSSLSGGNSNLSWTTPTWTTPSGGIGGSITYDNVVELTWRDLQNFTTIFTESGTWTTNYGYQYTRIILIGGGGAGARGDLLRGGGNGGDSYDSGVLETSTFAASAAIVVGAGGIFLGSGGKNSTFNDGNLYNLLANGAQNTITGSGNGQNGNASGPGGLNYGGGGGGAGSNSDTGNSGNNTTSGGVGGGGGAGNPDVGGNGGNGIGYSGSGNKIIAGGGGGGGGYGTIHGGNAGNGALFGGGGGGGGGGDSLRRGDGGNGGAGAVIIYQW